MSKSVLGVLLAAILLVVGLISCLDSSTTPPAPTPTQEPARSFTPAPPRIISGGPWESAAEDLLKIHGIEPYLTGNLLFISHWDEEVRGWLVYDVAGHFTPDQLTPPPGVAVPPDPEIGILDKLERGKLYDFHVRGDQIVNILEGETGDWLFNSGANFIRWPR